MDENRGEWTIIRKYSFQMYKVNMSLFMCEQKLHGTVPNM